MTDMSNQNPPEATPHVGQGASVQAKKPWPVIATILVVLAVISMIGLGVWQLQRKSEKEALIALFERNMAMTAPVAYPEMPPVEPEFLYRRSSLVCLEVVRFVPRGGSDRAGKSGIRMVAECKTGADGPGALVDIGTADDFTLPNWTGGPVSGWIVPGPEQPTMIAQLTGNAVPSRPLLVAEKAEAGLRPSAVPSAADTPNNHFAYAMQWFFFAIAAAIIFALAVRRHLRA